MGRDDQSCKADQPQRGSDNIWDGHRLEPGVNELGLHTDGCTGKGENDHCGKDYRPEIFPCEDRLLQPRYDTIALGHLFSLSDGDWLK